MALRVPLVTVGADPTTGGGQIELLRLLLAVATKQLTRRCDVTCRTTGATGTVIGCGDTSFIATVGGLFSTSSSIDFIKNTTTATIDTTATQFFDLTIQTAAADAGATYTSQVAGILVLS